MLSKTQKEKLEGEYKWDSAQQEATFNKNMRMKLKQRIRELSELALILESLPPRVLENAKLEEDISRVVEFVDIFLKKVSPLPVGLNNSGKKMVFRNIANKIDNDHPNLNGLEKMGWIINANGDKYIVDSVYWTASPAEIHNWRILKNHCEKLQQYIDPTIVPVGIETLPESEITKMVIERGRLSGDFELHNTVIKPKDGFPIAPPNQPCIIDETK